MSKKKPKPMVVVVTEQALALLSKGNRCPKVAQLLAPLNGRKPRTRLRIRTLLASVRRKLLRKYEVHACCVSRLVYTGVTLPNGRVRVPFLKKPPESRKEALLCLPFGPNKIAGLYFPKERDSIYEEFLLKYSEQGLQEYRLNTHRASSGLEQKVLSGRTVPKRLGNLLLAYLEDALGPLLENAISKAASQVVLALEEKKKPKS